MNEIIKPMRVPYVGTAPEKGRPTDAAYDLRSAQARTIQPGDWMLVQTGFQMGVPRGHAGLVLSRSGLALKHGVFVLNAPGLIDPDYIGDIGVILMNGGKFPFSIQKGDRIAQLMFVETAYVSLREVDTLEDTGRGANGFGSSGVA